MKYVLLLLLSIASVKSIAQETEALKYIKENAIPLDTNINDTQDLEILKTVLAGNRVIGLGEATHGTHEFQTNKVRIFKYLVTQLQYNVFGIEANFTRCRKVNDYIANGKGDAKKAIAGVAFWMWNTREILELVEWLRNYNQTRPDDQKVKFYGFDMQYDTYIIPQLVSNLKKADSTFFESHFARLKQMNVARTKLSDQQRDSIKSLLTDLKGYADNKSADLLKTLSKNELAYIKHDIRLLEQCLELNLAQSVSFNRMAAITKARDGFMCENIQWILEHEGSGSKMALWAHDLHIAKTATSRGAMGAYLKEAFKDQYYALGFDFNKGSFRAGDMQARKINTFNINAAEKGSSGYFFAQTGLPQFFIDINNAAKTSSSAKKFFMQKIAHLTIGDSYTNEKDAYLKDALTDMYDGLIFINETTGSLPIN